LLLIRRCTQLDIDTPQDTTSAAAYTLRLLARRILALTDEIRVYRSKTRCRSVTCGFVERIKPLGGIR
jgi:hypothetical protein